MDRMAPRLPFRAATDFDKFLTSQILQVLSWFPVAKVMPSECHADANEKSKCPHRGATVCKNNVLSISQQMIYQNDDPADAITSTFPVCESTNKPSGLSPTITRSLPSGFKAAC